MVDLIVVYWFYRLEYSFLIHWFSSCLNELTWLSLLQSILSMRSEMLVVERFKFGSSLTSATAFRRPVRPIFTNSSSSSSPYVVFVVVVVVVALVDAWSFRVDLLFVLADNFSEDDDDEEDDDSSIISFQNYLIWSIVLEFLIAAATMVFFCCCYVGICYYCIIRIRLSLNPCVCVFVLFSAGAGVKLFASKQLHSVYSLKSVKKMLQNFHWNCVCVLLF